MKELKICCRCKKEKSISDFYKNKHRPGGLHYECKACTKIEKEKYRIQNRIAQKLYRRRQILKKFKKTLDDYNNIMESQSECCAICKTHKSKFKKGFAIDHDHETNTFRGLLCPKCNTGLGQFNDDINLLRKAILYLTYRTPKYKPTVRIYV